MAEQYEFIGRVDELEELYDFIHSSDAVLFVLVGKPGMGKSSLVREFHARLQEDRDVLLCHLFDANRDWPPEELASDIAHALSKGQFLLWGPDDRRKLKTVASAIPLVGPLIEALIEDKSKSNRFKLIDILNTLTQKSLERIVLIIDPFDYIEKSEYEDFFTTLARSLPPKVKIVVPQRPADVLAKSSLFLALPTVRTNRKELGPLPKEDSYQMARSLLTATNKSPDVLARTLWEQSNGWPLALYIGANAIARGESLSSFILGDIEKLCAHLLDNCPIQVRQLLYAAALPSLDFYMGDLRMVSGLTPEEFAQAFEDPAAKQVLIQQHRFSAISVRLFHVIFRDYVRDYMARLGISRKPYLERLHIKLLEDAERLYGEMDTKNVTERDAMALLFASKLRLYDTLLKTNERMSRLAEILLSRIDSLRYGGRSYSLYSLLVLAQNGALVIQASDGERFLKVLHRILVEDSFLHPEYAVLLIGSILTSSKNEIHPEAIRICRSRIAQLAQQTYNRLLAEISSSVHYSLEQGVNPLIAFELDHLLPTAYREDDFEEGEELNSADSQLRAKHLIEVPVTRWTAEDHSFMHRYIRHSEEKLS